MSHASAPASFAQRLADVRTRIARAAERSGRRPEAVTLIGVSKTWPASAVLEGFAAGLRDFGENRVQEGVAKVHDVAEVLKGDGPTWHLIGHLQTNKIRAALGAFAILHAVDSERLLRAISAAATAVVPLMIEVNVAAEPTKYGIVPADLPALLDCAAGLPGVDVFGLMTVAPQVTEPEGARTVFRELRLLGEKHKLSALSMGMTNDYEVAIEEGATHVRVGRGLFGERP